MDDFLLRALFTAVCTSISVPLTFQWVKRLYASCDPAILSFPERLATAPHKRLLLLTIATTTAFFFLSRSGDPLHIARGSIGIFFLLLVCVTDFEQQVIFDKVLIVFALLALPFSLVLRLNPQDLALAAIAGGASFFFLTLATRGAIGMGDAKLIAVLGLWMGTDDLMSICFLGILLGGIAAILLLVLRIKGRKDFIAFGPWFALPALLFFLAK